MSDTGGGAAGGRGRSTAGGGPRHVAPARWPREFREASGLVKAKAGGAGGGPATGGPNRHRPIRAGRRRSRGERDRTRGSRPRTAATATRPAAQPRPGERRPYPICSRSMVGVSGFEPPAPASRRQCSTRLSYTPTVGRGYIASSHRRQAACRCGRRMPRSSGRGSGQPGSAGVNRPGRRPRRRCRGGSRAARRGRSSPAPHGPWRRSPRPGTRWLPAPRAA